MWGTYQNSELRVEVTANADDIRRSLTEPKSLQAWLRPQQLKTTSGGSLSTASLSEGQVFESHLGPLKVRHKVELLSDEGVRFLLSEGIDGFHEWQWGEGWVQSRIEGVSLLPLNLGQTASMLRLRHYLQQ